MPQVKAYNPRNIMLIPVGLPGITGFASGSKVKIAFPNQGFTVIEGVEGDMTRSATNTGLVQITFRLLQTSISNAILSAAYEVDRASDNGAGIAPTTIKDKAGTTLFYCPETWIQKLPDSDFANEDTFREWVVEGRYEVAIVGGN